MINVWLYMSWIKSLNLGSIRFQSNILIIFAFTNVFGNSFKSIFYDKYEQFDVISSYDDFKIANLKKQMRIAFLSSWKIKCGIADYAETLFNYLKKEKFNVFAYSNEISANDLISEIIKNKINILNVQYHPALFQDTNKFIILLKRIINKGVKIIVTVHGEREDFPLIQQLVDQIIFHRKSVYLKQFRQKNHLIPMAIPEFLPKENKLEIRKRYGFSQTDKIIVTNGFMFTFKKIPEILTLIIPYLKNNKNYKLQLLTAFNDTNLSECCIENNKIKEIIKYYNVEDQVLHITNFLTQSELKERLWLSDIGYLWVDRNSIETSGAAKNFISVKLPLVVPDSTHFHDLSLGVIKTPMDKKKFVETIFNILHSEELQILEKESNVIYNKLNYDVIIKKIIEIYDK